MNTLRIGNHSGLKHQIPADLPRKVVERLLQEVGEFEEGPVGSLLSDLLIDRYYELQSELRSYVEGKDSHGAAMVTGAMKILELLLQEGYGLKEPLLEELERHGREER